MAGEAMKTAEQLQQLLSVAERTRDAYPNVKWFSVADLQRSHVAFSVTCSEHVAAFDPTTCAELVREVMRLREDLRILTKGKIIQS
jgi:hypothetical protein